VPEEKAVAGRREKKEKREVLRTGGSGGKEGGKRGKKKEGYGPAVGPHPKKSISNVARANRITWHATICFIK
jgi:hypothetical protein